MERRKTIFLKEPLVKKILHGSYHDLAAFAIGEAVGDIRSAAHEKNQDKLNACIATLLYWSKAFGITKEVEERVERIKSYAERGLWPRVEEESFSLSLFLAHKLAEY